jgi:hypothetical protein
VDRRATGQHAWLLFSDADAERERNSASLALQVAQEHQAVPVSFSPEQITETWYEKALIPYIYLRLAKRFSYEKVNDPNSPAAAANGQFGGQLGTSCFWQPTTCARRRDRHYVFGLEVRCFAVVSQSRCYFRDGAGDGYRAGCYEGYLRHR